MTWRHQVNILWSSFCNAFCDVTLRKCKDSKLKKKMENWSQASCVASGNVWVQTLTVGTSPLQVREYKHGLKRGDKIAHITHVICIRCGHSFVLSPYEPVQLFVISDDLPFDICDLPWHETFVFSECWQLDLENEDKCYDIQATWRLEEFLPAGLQIEIVISHFLCKI